MYRAKTKTKLAYSLLAILGVVFAFIIGVTYCASAFLLNVGSNGYSTSTFVAKQQYAIINDTKTSPIPFGSGAHNYEVAIQYSYSYDIDVRIKYSLSWSDGLDTHNVILNYANRDNFMVDDTYIYVRDTIDAGTGKLTIFTGVDFTDTNDLNYVGAYLTINIDEVKVYKAQDSYNSEHALVKDINLNNYPSAQAWLKYKQNDSSSSAFVISYNKLYGQYGAKHPINAGAYSKLSDNYRWLGGNQYYAGVGIYIVTGSSPIKLTAKVSARWISSGSGQSGQIYENNIKLNYADNWQIDSTQTDEIFPTYYYTMQIPAHSAVYIEIIDNLEITTRGSNFDTSVYSNSQAVIFSLYLNEDNSVFTYIENSSISFGEIETSNSSLVSSVNTAYSQEDYTIINSTDYSSLLYTYNNTASQQVYEINLSVTNNTANAMQLNSLSFTLGYYVSNGNNSPYLGDDFGSTDWYRWEDSASSSYISVRESSNNYIPAYSTTNISTYITVSANFQTDLIENNFGSYDCYVYLIPNLSISTISSNISQSDIEFGVDEDSNLGVFYLKNNTTSVLNITSVSLKLQKINYEFTALQTFPTTWANDYWQYYVYDSASGTYIRNTTSDQSAGARNFYQLTINNETISFNNATSYNGFSRSGDTFTNSSAKLKPGETILVATMPLTFTINNGYVRYAMQYLDSSTPSVNASASNNDTIDIMFEGTDNAYIINNSDSAYFVRFTGTTMQNTGILTDGSWNYFIGIVRAGQIQKIPMSSVTGTINVEYILVPETFTSSTLSSWSPSQSVLDAFDTYFLGE